MPCWLMLPLYARRPSSAALDSVAGAPFCGTVSMCARLGADLAHWEQGRLDPWCGSPFAQALSRGQHDSLTALLGKTPKRGAGEGLPSC